MTESEYVTKPCGTVGCPLQGLSIDVDERTAAALLLSFHRDDPAGAQAIIGTTDSRFLLGVMTAWINGMGISQFGPDRWDKLLESFLRNEPA